MSSIQRYWTILQIYVFDLWNLKNLFHLPSWRVFLGALIFLLNTGNFRKIYSPPQQKPGSRSIYPPTQQLIPSFKQVQFKRPSTAILQ